MGINLYKMKNKNTERKVFVLDTSVLIYHEDSIHGFPGCDIILPIEVLEEVDNIKTRNDAENFRNSKLFIKRESLPKLSDDEFYHRDLISFEVYNTKRESFGFIVSLNDFGGGLLLEVNKDNKMFYLPASKRFLNEIKYKEKEVILNLDLSFLNG